MFGRDDRENEPKVLTNRERLHRNDIMRFRVLGWPITANKFHALKYGTVGFFVGALAVAHFTTGMLLSIGIIFFALGIRGLPDQKVKMDSAEWRGPPIGVLTVRYKPHYFMLSYLLSFIIGFGAAGVVV